jgi:uncharacterized protein DUF4412
MKSLSLILMLVGSLAFRARADLTIVQQVEGGSQSGEVTVRIKGDMERIDTPSQPSRIIDGKAGQMIDLLNDQKTFIRISADQMKAAAQTMEKLDTSEPDTEKPKLKPTGNKGTVGGYDTEEYVYETPTFTASFWIASKYPGSGEILKQLQAPFAGAWKPSNMGMPNYTDFPGLPLKTIISTGQGEVTTTITSVKQDRLSDADFQVPKDFQEMKRPLPNVSPVESASASPSASP